MRAGHRAVIGALVAMGALAMAQPANAQFFPSDCRVSGGGQIVSATGDRATFGGSAVREGPTAARGHEVFIDHGPATELRFRSLTVNAMVCNLDARTAVLTGQGRVETDLGLGEIVQYRIEVFAPNNRGGSPDFYRITLSNGYESGFQPVVHGNIVLQER
jgi:hypothetical protein